jgi:hypothetical protein
MPSKNKERRKPLPTRKEVARGKRGQSGGHKAHPREATVQNATKERVSGVLRKYGTTTDVRQIPTCDLTPEVLPKNRAEWQTIVRFANSFDGYDYWGDRRKCGEIGNTLRKHYFERGTQHFSMEKLRTALFFEARRYHHFGSAPDKQSMGYIRTIVSEIRRRLPASA